jgi:Xaa-Pro aminopeptidase
MPADCYRQIIEGFSGVELVDVTRDYVELRYIKSPWEIEQIRAAFKLADECYEAMKAAVGPGVSEIEVAAAGEHAARRQGASGFGFSAIVGSGKRANAVVPTASSKKLQPGELVMLGLAPKVQGYAGVFGDSVPVTGPSSASQKECLRHLGEAFRLTKGQLVVGRTGRQIDAPARGYFAKHNLSKYLVCPFAHTIGLHEAESPFFGPNSDDVLKPGMAVCVDVSFFGHPEWNGVRIETGFEITAQGAAPFSPKMDRILSDIQ